MAKLDVYLGMDSISSLVGLFVTRSYFRLMEHSCDKHVASIISRRTVMGYQMLLFVRDTVTTAVILEYITCEMEHLTSDVQRVYRAPSQLWISLTAARVSV